MYCKGTWAIVYTKDRVPCGVRLLKALYLRSGHCPKDSVEGLGLRV